MLYFFQGIFKFTEKLSESTEFPYIIPYFPSTQFPLSTICISVEHLLQVMTNIDTFLLLRSLVYKRVHSLCLHISQNHAAPKMPSALPIHPFPHPPEPLATTFYLPCFAFSRMHIVGSYSIAFFRLASFTCHYTLKVPLCLFLA